MDIYYLYSQSFAKKKESKKPKKESLHAHTSISHMLDDTRNLEGLGAGGSQRY